MKIPIGRISFTPIFDTPLEMMDSILSVKISFSEHIQELAELSTIIDDPS